MGEADHYKTLGLRRDATRAEVKAAFSRLALLHHPDRHVKAGAATKAEATRRFREAYDAYHVLYDDGRRAEYDLRTPPSAWSGFGYGGGKPRSSSASTGSGYGAGKSSSASSGSGYGAGKSSSASTGSGYGTGKSRSSSSSSGWFSWFGGAPSSPSPDSSRYRYQYQYGYWPSPTQRKVDESLGVWMRANWYPLLYM
jgi:DnaJ-class molecular chaperone